MSVAQREPPFPVLRQGNPNPFRRHAVPGARGDALLVVSSIPPARRHGPPCRSGVASSGESYRATDKDRAECDGSCRLPACLGLIFCRERESADGQLICRTVEGG